MKVVAIQSNYLPWKGYFDLIRDADKFVFYDEVQYTKNDWRNRNKVYSKNCVQWITIPVAHTSVKLRISEVRCPNTNWQIKHFKTLTNCYSNSPYFKNIKALLDRVYLNTQWEYLADLNRFIIKTISELIGINTMFLNSADFDLGNGKINRLIELLCKTEATEYISGPSARKYLVDHENLFFEKGIQLVYKNYNGYPEYQQRRSRFVHEVSILDLIANIPLSDIPYFIWGWRD